MEYTWKCTSLKVKNENGFNNAVVQVYWTVTGTDTSGNSGSFNGTTPFTTASLADSSAFVPYEELTEADVLGWVKQVVVNEYWEHVVRQIDNQIAEGIAPKSAPALPWLPTQPAPVVEANTSLPTPPLN